VKVIGNASDFRKQLCFGCDNAMSLICLANLIFGPRKYYDDAANDTDGPESGEPEFLDVEGECDDEQED